MNRFAGLGIPPSGTTDQFQTEDYSLLQAQDCGRRLCADTDCKNCLFDSKHLAEFTLWYNEQREA